jgi:ribose 5-phosphate isomerase B
MIYLGSDHRGFELKGKIKNWLTEWGYDFEDLGPYIYNKDDDYPDAAKTVAERVLAQKGNKGVLICGSGIGIIVAANKVKGIRAGSISTEAQVRASVNDEDLNIIGLSADYTEEDVAREIVRAFIETKFSEAERHVRRVKKLAEMEK